MDFDPRTLDPDFDPNRKVIISPEIIGKPNGLANNDADGEVLNANGVRVIDQITEELVENISTQVSTTVSDTVSQQVLGEIEGTVLLKTAPILTPQERLGSLGPVPVVTTAGQRGLPVKFLKGERRLSWYADLAIDDGGPNEDWSPAFAAAIAEAEQTKERSLLVDYREAPYKILSPIRFPKEGMTLRGPSKNERPLIWNYAIPTPGGKTFGDAFCLHVGWMHEGDWGFVNTYPVTSFVGDTVVFQNSADVAQVATVGKPMVVAINDFSPQGGSTARNSVTNLMARVVSISGNSVKLDERAETVARRWDPSLDWGGASAGQHPNGGASLQLRATKLEGATSVGHQTYICDTPVVENLRFRSDNASWAVRGANYGHRFKDIHLEKSQHAGGGNFQVRGVTDGLTGVFVKKALDIAEGNLFTTYKNLDLRFDPTAAATAGSSALIALRGQCIIEDSKISGGHAPWPVGLLGRNGFGIFKNVKLDLICSTTVLLADEAYPEDQGRLAVDHVEINLLGSDSVNFPIRVESPNSRFRKVIFSNGTLAAATSPAAHVQANNTLIEECEFGPGLSTGRPLSTANDPTIVFDNNFFDTDQGIVFDANLLSNPKVRVQNNRSKVDIGKITVSGSGGVADGSVTENKLSTSAVTTNKIAADAVTRAKIVNDAIDGSKIANGVVSTTKISDNAVNAAKLAPNSVTSEKIADNSVSVNKIVENAVTRPKIADLAIINSKIADGVISSSKLSNNAVTGDKLGNNSVTGDKISDNSVSTSKISDGSVSSSKLAPNTITEGLGNEGLSVIDVPDVGNQVLTSQDGAIVPVPFEDFGTGVKKIYTDDTGPYPDVSSGQTVKLSRGLKTEEYIIAGDETTIEDFEGPGIYNGPLPHFDGSKDVPAGDWTDNGDGTFSVVWNHEVAKAKATILLHEVDSNQKEILPHYTRITSNIGALVDRSYFVNFSPGTSPTTTPVTITVRPGPGKNPTTVNTRYRASFAQNPVKAGTNSLVEGITARRCGHENGIWIDGTTGTVRRVAGIDMFVHAVTLTDVKNGLIEDAISLRSIPEANANPRGFFAFTIALPDVPGGTAAFRRCLAIGSANKQGKGFHCHPVPGGLNYELAVLKDCATLGMSGAFNGTANRVIIDGFYGYDLASPLVPTTNKLEIIRSRFRLLGQDPIRILVLGGGPNLGISLQESFLRGDGIGDGRMVFAPTGTAISAINSVFDGRGDRGSIQSSTSTTLNRSVVRTDNGIAVDANSGTYTGDHNLFLFTGGTFRARIGGTTHTSLAAWRTATGQDLNSVALFGADAQAVLDTNDSGDARIDRAYLTGTSLENEAVGMTTPFTAWPVYPTTEEEILNPSVFPLIPR